MFESGSKNSLLTATQCHVHKEGEGTSHRRLPAVGEETQENLAERQGLGIPDSVPVVRGQFQSELH